MQERPKSVLVIDDQPDERVIQRSMLGHLGYVVREAESGALGLDEAIREPPDLVLLDVAMPHMDGFTVCRMLRQNPTTAAIPILLFTASVFGDLAEQARAAGADGVLAKPVDPHEVAAEVRRMIGPAQG